MLNIFNCVLNNSLFSSIIFSQLISIKRFCQDEQIHWNDQQQFFSHKYFIHSNEHLNINKSIQQTNNIDFTNRPSLNKQISLFFSNQSFQFQLSNPISDYLHHNYLHFDAVFHLFSNLVFFNSSIQIQKKRFFSKNLHSINKINNRFKSFFLRIDQCRTSHRIQWKIFNWTNYSLDRRQIKQLFITFILRFFNKITFWPFFSHKQHFLLRNNSDQYLTDQFKSDIDFSSPNI